MHPSADAVPISLRLMSAFGLGFMIFLAWTMSYDRKRFPWRVVLWGTGLQIFFGLLVLRTSGGLYVFSKLNAGVENLLKFTEAGSAMVFGTGHAFSFAINVLPTIIFFSALMAVLYHFRVMQKVVNGMAWVMQKTMKTSGPETLSAAANIFVGQTEAPLVIKPFLEGLTRSELAAVMIGGFANVAGGVLAAFVGMLHHHFPDIAGHLIASSVMSAPASLLLAKVLVPPSKEEAEKTSMKYDEKSPYSNAIDAAASGASEGLGLALNVAAMLIAFTALVALMNGIVQAAWPDWSLQRGFGYLFSPLAFVMGVPKADCLTVGGFLGEKMVLNEFVAYTSLAENVSGPNPLSDRATLIASYALCGFANFSSIAIQVGGIGALAPERRKDLAELGLRTMLVGALATFMTACVAGILV